MLETHFYKTDFYEASEVIQGVQECSIPKNAKFEEFLLQ